MATSQAQCIIDQGESNTSVLREPSASVLAKLSHDAIIRLRHLSAQPVEFIDSDSFAKRNTAKDLFGDCLGSDASARPWCNSVGAYQNHESSSAVPAPTLGADEERRFFLQMNYARYRMAQIQVKYAGKRLTARAAAEILWWDTQAETVKDMIVRANVPLVLAMAKRTRLGNMDYAELISEGNMALLRSVDKFDCGRGFKFSTYACRAILKSFSRVAMKTSRYRSRFPTEFDPSLERSDFIEQRRLDHEADCLAELRGIISSNAAALNEVEAKVIQARFALGRVEGLEGDGPKTLEQVGLLIGVTKERVRQIQNRALGKLREKLQEDFLAA